MTGLMNFFEEDEKQEFYQKETDEWKNEWIGMPEFIQEEERSYHSIKMSFKTKEDMEEFAKFINQTVSERTKSIWFPKLKIKERATLRWVDEDEE